MAFRPFSWAQCNSTVQKTQATAKASSRGGGVSHCEPSCVLTMTWGLTWGIALGQSRDSHSFWQIFPKTKQTLAQ